MADVQSFVARVLRRFGSWWRRPDAITPEDRARGVRSVRDDIGPPSSDDPKFPSL